ncbi:MAG: Hpt domain-containing protein [Gemmatimonadetes bacterium]|nr:Hpt domain-containing protein [Gemmatimonadota bacterium]MBK7783986.1 Hpt domain-containing protein [Gemmatimonadota bacterium]
MAERPVLDPQILQRLQGMDDDGTFVAELAQVFLTEAPIRWTAIVGCSRAGRAPDVVGLAHALKGSAASLGLVRVQEASRAIEATARAGQVPGAEALALLERELAAARQVLQPLARPVEA